MFQFIFTCRRVCLRAKAGKCRQFKSSCWPSRRRPLKAVRKFSLPSQLTSTTRRLTNCCCCCSSAAQLIRLSQFLALENTTSSQEQANAASFCQFALQCHKEETGEEHPASSGGCRLRCCCCCCWPSNCFNGRLVLISLTAQCTMHELT